MNTTFQNSAQVLSIGIFFSLMIAGLSAALPESLSAGLIAHGVSRTAAEHAAHLPAVSTLFAAFLGYDPIAHLIGAHQLSLLSASQQHALTGRSFFPSLISGPFQTGLHAALDFAIVASLAAAWASWLRGGRYVFRETSTNGVEAPDVVTVGAGPDEHGSANEVVDDDNTEASSMAQEAQ
jgi:hypothetical protein